jgi:hypothetical protein
MISRFITPRTGASHGLNSTWQETYTGRFPTVADTSRHRLAQQANIPSAPPPASVSHISSQRNTSMMSAAFVTGPSIALRARVPTVAVSSRAAPAMSLRANIARAAATIPAALLAAPALAEGTGESFGVDSPLLLLPLVVRRPFVAMTTLAAVLRRVYFADVTCTHLCGRFPYLLVWSP